MSAPCEVRRQGGGAAVVVALTRPPEGWTAAARQEVCRQIAAAKYVVLDLGGLATFDWDDFELLVSARKAHRARWGTHLHLVKVVSGTGTMRQRVEAMQIEHFMPTYRSVAEALAAMPRRRALHLEPDDELASTVEILLETNGFEVVRCRRPVDLPPPGDRPFDIVITEVAFDGRLDPDLVRRLRLELRAPVGVLSRSAVDRVDGAAFVLAPPVQSTRLMDRMEKALERPLTEYYETLFDLVPLALGVVSASGELVRTNRAWRLLLTAAPDAQEQPGVGPGAGPAALPPAIEGRAGALERAVAVARNGGQDELVLDWPDPAGGPGRKIRLSITGAGVLGDEPHALVLAAEADGPGAAAPPRPEGDGNGEMRTALLSLLEDLDRSRVELEGANRRLQELDRLKSDFVSTVSHELRTPITAIKGSVENLLDGLVGPVDNEQRRALEIVLRNGTRLARLIDNLLDLARLEGGRIELVRKRIDLRDPVRQAVEEVAPLAEQHGVAIDLVLTRKPAEAEGDFDRMVQVTINLLDNALRFARRRVRVALERQGRDARLEVTDDGPGVPPEDLERIFDRFARVRTHPDKSHTGLGLSIVRAIVEGLGGHAWAENVPEAEGGGARFLVLVPLAPRVPARDTSARLPKVSP